MKKIIKKIYNKIISIKKDKLLHFICGLLITEISSLIITLYSHSFYGGCIAGLFIGILVAMIKELCDMNNDNHSCELNDFLYTILGSLIGAMLMFLAML